MSDTPIEGNMAPPPSSQMPPAQEPTPPSETSTEEQSSSFPKEEASKLVGSNTDLHPIKGDPEKDAAEFEAQKKSDLDAQREEHLRRRSGGESQE